MDGTKVGGPAEAAAIREGFAKAGMRGGITVEQAVEKAPELRRAMTKRRVG